MNRLLTLLTISLFISLSTTAQKDEQAIRAILANQNIQWNKGNIEAFMHGYWNSDSLLFVGKTGTTYGYQKTLANYKKGYPDTAAMGKLGFEILKVQKLSSDYYFVLGKWALTRSIGNISGHYTLLFKKINNQWVIVVDHSS
ncbi:MAG: nuclear transport factor 2 family protein [Sediminibacterium sp.]